MGQGGAGAPWHSTLIGKSLIVASYLCLNLSLNLLNKWIISVYGFGFPLFLGICHMLFTMAALLPVMLMPSYRALHRPTLERSWMGVLGIGCFFAVNIGFNNMSLASVSLSLNQVIRSTIPVITCLTSVLVESRVPSRQEIGSLAMLVSGVCVAVYEGAGKNNASYGVLLCLAGTVSNGLMMSFSGRVLSDRMDALRLAFYTAPVSCLMLLPFFVRLESEPLALYRSQAQASYVGLVALSCVIALAYNMCHYMMIYVTSSVTTTVIDEMRIILILLLSAVLLGESGLWTFKFVTGCTIAILGLCLYSSVRLKAAQLSSVPVIKGVPELAPLLRPSASLSAVSSRLEKANLDKS